MWWTGVLALGLALAACGPDRRQVDLDFAAKEAAIQAGVAAQANARVAAAEPPPGMRPAPMVETALSCADGSMRTLRYFPEQGIAILLPEGRGKELQMEPVASGVRYAGYGIEVSGKGTSYMITMGDSAPLACTAEG